MPGTVKRASASAASKSQVSCTSVAANCKSTTCSSSSGQLLNPPINLFHQNYNVFPVATADSDILYEVVVFIFSTSALLLQLLHIYRTVWWLPQSYTHHAVKLHLINPNVIGLFGLITVPRLLWTVITTSIGKSCKASWQSDVRKTLKAAVTTLWTILYAYLFIKFLHFQERDSKWFLYVISCFLYPIVPYAILWKGNCSINVLFELVPHNLTNAGFTREWQLSNNAEVIRHNIGLLKKDFNERLQRALFHAFLTSYGATVLPCLFAQSYVVYDIVITAEHMLAVFIGAFTINAVHAFPLNHCKLLHDAAKYLGSWNHIDKPGDSFSSSSWCPKTVYSRGAVVSYNNVLYESSQNFNVSVPGDAHYKKFQGLLGKSGRFQACLLMLQMLLVSLQMVLLLRSTEWHQMISMTFMQAMSCYALFNLIRDNIIAWRLMLNYSIRAKSVYNEMG